MSRPAVYLSDAAYMVGLGDLIKRCEGVAPVRLTISQTIINDLDVRCPDADGCWRGIEHAGVHTVSRQQAREIAGDCEYQGNIGGNYIDPVSGGLTRAYRALHAQIQEALK
jgi:hypothetical protein